MSNDEAEKAAREWGSDREILVGYPYSLATVREAIELEQHAAFLAGVEWERKRTEAKSEKVWVDHAEWVSQINPNLKFRHVYKDYDGSPTSDAHDAFYLVPVDEEGGE